MRPSSDLLISFPGGGYKHSLAITILATILIIRRFKKLRCGNPAQKNLREKTFFYNVYSHKEKKIQCRYESPREEAREGHDYLVIEKKIESVLHQALPRGEKRNIGLST